MIIVTDLVRAPSYHYVLVNKNSAKYKACSVGCGFRRGLNPSNEIPGCDARRSDAEVSVKLKLCGMSITPSLPSLLGPLWR